MAASSLGPSCHTYFPRSTYFITAIAISDDGTTGAALTLDGSIYGWNVPGITRAPTIAPTQRPSQQPTQRPTRRPTFAPSQRPTAFPGYLCQANATSTGTPLSTSTTASLYNCWLACDYDYNCFYFSYNTTTGQCMIYGRFFGGTWPLTPQPGTVSRRMVEWRGRPPPGVRSLTAGSLYAWRTALVRPHRQNYYAYASWVGCNVPSPKMCEANASPLGNQISNTTELTLQHCWNKCYYQGFCYSFTYTNATNVCVLYYDFDGTGVWPTVPQQGTVRGGGRVSVCLCDHACPCTRGTARRSPVSASAVVSSPHHPPTPPLSNAHTHTLQPLV